MKIAMKKSSVKMLASALLVFYSTSAFASIGTTLKNKFLEIGDELTIAAIGVVVCAIILGAFQSMVLKTPISRWIYIVFVSAILIAFASEIGQWVLKK